MSEHINSVLKACTKWYGMYEKAMQLHASHALCHFKQFVLYFSKESAIQCAIEDRRKHNITDDKHFILSIKCVVTPPQHTDSQTDGSLCLSYVCLKDLVM